MRFDERLGVWTVEEIRFRQSLADCKVPHIKLVREIDQAAHFLFCGEPAVGFLLESLKVDDQYFWSFVDLHLFCGKFVLFAFRAKPFITLLKSFSLLELSKALT